MGVREWVERKVDAVRRPIETQRARGRYDSQRSAAREYAGRSREIENLENNREISRHLAEKWRGRARERYEKRRVPRIDRAGQAGRAILGNIGENVQGDFAGGRKRVAKKMYGSRGVAKSYSHSTKGEFTPFHSTDQFGVFLISGKQHTMQTEGKRRKSRRKKKGEEEERFWWG